MSYNFVMYVGHFNKRINSTKRPSKTTYKSWDKYENMMLKGSSSIENPTFIMNTSDFDITANYAVVQWINLKTSTQFVRYYFIPDNVINVGNTVTVSLSMDYPASWKDTIYDIESAYVLRTNAPGYYDLHLIDSMATHNDQVYTQKTNIMYSEENNRMLANSPIGGSIVFITAGGSTSIQDVVYNTTGHVYACNPVCFARLMANAGSKDTLPTSGVEEPLGMTKGLLGVLFPNGTLSADTESLAGAYFNPSDYILSAFWLPISVADNKTAQANNSSIDKKPLIGGQAVTYLNVGGTKWYHGANKADGRIYQLTSLNVMWNWAICKVDSSMGMQAGVPRKRYFTHEGVRSYYWTTPVTGWAYNNWTDRSPAWSQYQIYLPCLGMSELPAEYAGQDLRFNYNLDVVTGDCDVKYYLSDGTCIGWQRGNLGVPLQITSLTNDYSSYLNATSANANLQVAAAGASYTMGSLVTSGINSLASVMQNYSESGASLTTDYNNRNSIVSGDEYDSFGMRINASYKEGTAGSTGRWVG